MDLAIDRNSPALLPGTEHNSRGNRLVGSFFLSDGCTGTDTAGHGGCELFFGRSKARRTLLPGVSMFLLLLIFRYELFTYILE